jgi:transcriptional regulator with GAF, ATPase, and Fis domain
MTEPILDRDRLLQSIFRISALLTVQADLNEVLTKILDELVDTIGFDKGTILLLDDTKEFLRVKVVKNYSPEEAVQALSTALHCRKHDCLATRVARTGEPVAIGSDVFKSSRLTDVDRMMTKIAAGSTICAPLKNGEEVIGVIAAWCDKEIKFFPEEIDLFLALTSQMSIIVHNARLFAKDKEKIARLLLLEEAVSKMNDSYGRLERILEIAAQASLNISRAERVQFCVGDKPEGMDDHGRKHTRLETACDMEVLMPAEVVKKALEAGGAVVKARGSAASDISPLEGSGSEVAIPFNIKDQCIGVLHLVGRRSGYDRDHLNILEILVNNAAAAYDNAIMHALLFREAETLKTEVEKLKEREDELMGFHDILGKSQKMIDIFHVIADVAGHNTNILIQGDSGTGKELIARAIHRHSPRNIKPFVDVNCAAIPATLLESELFGYEAGAFTDAKKKKIGLLEYAAGGTILLDEIGEMHVQLQAKFLRMLEDGHIRRLGGTENIPIDVRFIFATNRDLASMVAKGTFREDLLYRIRVVPKQIPPLRERKDDIILLARYFLRESTESSTRPWRIPQRGGRILLQYPWPGNVRELKNIIERVLILKGAGQVIQPQDVPAEIVAGTQKDGIELKIEPLLQQLPMEGLDYNLFTEKIDQDIRRRILDNALIRSRGNKSLAAKHLSISRYKFIREQKKLTRTASA